MFNYEFIFRKAKERDGYMKFLVVKEEYNELKSDLDKNFKNHFLDVITTENGNLTVIVGIVGVEYIG